jgi:hypothetical protein
MVRVLRFTERIRSSVFENISISQIHFIVEDKLYCMLVSFKARQPVYSSRIVYMSNKLLAHYDSASVDALTRRPLTAMRGVGFSSRIIRVTFVVGYIEVRRGWLLFSR